MKKNKKKLEKIKKGTILIILCGMILPFGLSGEENLLNRKIANLQGEIKRLNAENAGLKKTIEALKESSAEGGILRKELIETLDKYSTQAGRLKRMEMSAAGTIETLEPVYMGSRELELASDLKICADSIGELSVQILRYCDEMSAVLPEIIPDKVELVKMRLKLERLKEQALKAAMLARPAEKPGDFTKSRIVEVTRKPELVILSSGYRNGVRMGLLLKCGKHQLKVVALRPFMSAAVVLDGDIRELAPGMEVRPSRGK